MTTHKCLVCGDTFSNRFSHARYCTHECKLTAHRERAGRVTRDGKQLSTGIVGALSELRVCADLLSKGYAVFRALSQSCFCDAVAIKNEKTYSIEIRTGYKSMSGKVCFPKTLNGNPTTFAIFERNSGEITYIDVKTSAIVEM